MKKTKIIILTGGVYSSLGKGIIASSLGRILKEIGYSVSIMKFDPYLNIDPSQLNPKEHGEVFITKDGTKTDLDIGNYERFTGTDMNKHSSICSGIIYQEIINNQINNKYSGDTIQVIPHVTDAIIQKIYNNIEFNKTDFLIIEIGGTIGDVESIPFYESITRFIYKYGKENILLSHCVPLLSNKSNSEIKTKPAQHSIKELRSVGIIPEILFLRSEDKIDDELINKISNIVLIKKENIFNSFNVESTYFLVNELYNQNIHKIILDYFKINNDKDISNWIEFTESIKKSNISEIKKNILILGEFTSLHDAYFSVIESLLLTCYKHQINIEIHWKNINEINNKNVHELDFYDGIINGGYQGSNHEIDQLVFNYFENCNKPIINYGLGFLNLTNYLFENKNKSDENITGEITPLILDSELSKKLKNNQYKTRILSKQLVDKDVFCNTKTNYDLGSVFFDKYIDIIINRKNKDFISIFSNPEYNSKPNDVNVIYDNFISSLL